MKAPWNWLYEDLSVLTGQSENLRLEFKSSALLSKPRDEVARDLSKAASAFANTVGGTLVIGIREETVGKTKIAKGVDEGASTSVISPEVLQALIEGNLQPFLTGIRINPILIPGVEKKYAYVISIPQGSTAYQAKDHKYYGRSEYESRSLPDHEIRLRMFRSRSFQSVIKIIDLQTIEREYSKAQIDSQFGDKGKRYESFFSSKDKSEQLAIRTYSYSVVLLNTGELNITEFKVCLKFSNNDLSSHDTYQKTYRDGSYNNDPMKNLLRWPSKETAVEYPENITVFPQDTFRIVSDSFHCPAIQDITPLNLSLFWRVFLPDSLPIEGEVDVISEFSTYLAQCSLPQKATTLKKSPD